MKLSKGAEVSTDVRAYMLIEQFVGAQAASGKFERLLGRASVEDLVADAYVHFKERNLFGRYNPEITSFEYMIKMSVRNYMIDRSKQAEIKYVSASLDDQYGSDEDGTVSLRDLIVCDSWEEDILDLEDRDFLKIFSDEEQTTRTSNKRSDRRLIEKVLFEGCNKKDLASYWGITENSVMNMIQRIALNPTYRTAIAGVRAA